MKNKKSILKIVLLLVVMSACVVSGIYIYKNTQQRKQQRKLYEEAVETLSKTTLNEDGTYEVTEQLIVALNNAEYQEAKNVILMIGDGMGFHIVEAAQKAYAEQLYNNTLAMNCLPVQGSQCTYSSMNEVTDSAAGATALSTGYKTSNSVIAMDWNATEEYPTILEVAAEKGKSTGIVATKDVVDATTAAFSSHAADRRFHTDIAGQQLEKVSDGTLNLVLGGGSGNFEAPMNETFFAKAKEAGMTYTTTMEEALNASLPLVGLFSGTNLNTADESQPTVAEMTDLALNLLSEDEDGFFLMVEGSQIDSYGHGNELEKEVKEVYDFDCAVAVAMKYVAMNPDTVLIVTADHETGGLQNYLEEFVYATGSHTGVTVPVYAVGYGVEEFSGVCENTDIAIFIAEVFGEQDFGHTSTVYDVMKKKVNVSFTEQKGTYAIPMNQKEYKIANGENIRAIHVAVKNASDKVVQAPLMKIVCADNEYVVEAQIDYLNSGQEIILNYILPDECWLQNGIDAISELVLCLDEAKEPLQGQFEISYVKMRGRQLGK